MEDSLKYFLENSQVTNAAIGSRLMHPVSGLRYPARSVFDVLRNYSNDFFKSGSEPRLISLTGLRGVGKTTLLWQTANYIYRHFTKNIFFFNVNTLQTIGVDLHTALEEFQRNIIKQRFIEMNEPVVLLFDEVQDDENWSRTLKILFDEARTAFMLCTGSSALLLSQSADLARRMRIERIYPFSFSEFITAKSYIENKDSFVLPEPELDVRLREALFYSEQLSELFISVQKLEKVVSSYYSRLQGSKLPPLQELLQGYIAYQNIPNYLFFNDRNIINEGILSLFKRVILEDIPKIKPGYSDHTRIERLLLRLAGSDEINPGKLAGIIGISLNEINELIEVLAKAELLNVLQPYGGLDTRIAKNKKAFFMSPSLRSALLSSLYGQNLPENFRSKLVEDMAVMYMKRVLTDGIISFTTGDHKANPDFVIETRESPIILELGSGKTKTRQIKAEKINHRYGVLVSGGVISPCVKDNCLILPLNWFLLL